MKIFIIITIIILIILVVCVIACARVSDFGESADTLTEDEYNETCKAYNEYLKERQRIGE